MKEQNISPTEAPKEKTSPEKKGHLTRTQLYILLAILSIAILGLCGYIVWNSYSSVTSGESEVEKSTDDDTTSQEGVVSVKILIGDTSTQLAEGDEFVIDAASIDEEMGHDVGDMKVRLTDYDTASEIVFLEILADRIYDGSLFTRDPIDELELPVGEMTCTAGRPLVMDVALYYCFDTNLSGDAIEITVTLDEGSTMPKPTDGLTPTEFSVEYWKGDGGVITLEMGLPEDAEVSMAGGDATAFTTITIPSQNSMTLTFGIPHFGLNETFTDYTKVPNDTIPGLYRVTRSNGEHIYMNDLSLEGYCNHPTDEIFAPCGSSVIHFSEQEGVSVLYHGDIQPPDSLSLADKMMASLRIVE